jgi:hypothetical protein
LAQRRRCAAAILARPFADIFLRLRLGCPLLYTPAKALSAASIPDKRFATRSLSFFNCFNNEDTFAIEFPPRGGIVANSTVFPRFERNCATHTKPKNICAAGSATPIQSQQNMELLLWVLFVIGEVWLVIWLLTGNGKRTKNVSEDQCSEFWKQKQEQEGLKQEQERLRDEELKSKREARELEYPHWRLENNALVNKFLQITERKVSHPDEYDDENWDALPRGGKEETWPLYAVPSSAFSPTPLAARFAGG